jgi:hypothetical protein
MFDPPVALAMLQYLCQGRKEASETERMTAEFIVSKRERKSVVAPEQRHTGIFKAMQAEVDDLPPVFVRRACGDIQGL